MDKNWNILSVDDDENQSDSLKEILSSRMENNNFIFTKASNFDNGIELIKANRFDLIFLDVHEDSDPDPKIAPDKEDQKGEYLLKIIKENRFIPVIFYTGFPEKVKHLESPFVKIVTKGSDIENIRTAVKYVLSTKVLDLIRHIDEQSRSYMWGSLEKVFTKLTEPKNPPDISLLMARNLAQQLSQEVVKSIAGLDTNKINPLEMYKFPPTQGKWNPSDICKKNDETLWIILTTACDLEQSKADNILMAKVTPLKNHPLYIKWEEEKNKISLNNQDPVLKKNFAAAKSDVKNLVQGKKGNRYKFLPGTFFIENCIVDFQDLITTPARTLDQYDLVCHLDNPYKEEMLNLFSTYYGRIGTPDYDNEPIWALIDKNFNE